MKRAALFPGQGSQAVGMGKIFADTFLEARHVFQEVDEALKQKLSALMFEGPESDLTLTENAQPAIMATSIAILKVLEKEGNLKLSDICDYALGHSLGEYSALAACGALTVTDTARLLRIRGQAMQEAVPVGQGAMAAILGLELDEVRTVAEEASQGQICVAANDNAPGQVVVSGHMAAIDRAIELAKAKGAKRALKLAVSAPFHCPLMEPAAKRMEEALSTVTMNKPSIPIITNVTAESTTAPDELKQLLVEQVTGAVRWRESILFIAAQGTEQTVEIGAGNILSGLTRRIERDVNTVAFLSPSDIESFLKAL